MLGPLGWHLVKTLPEKPLADAQFGFVNKGRNNRQL